MLHQILQPVLQPVLRSQFDRRQTALTISQLLPSGAGRVAAIYSDPARPSYDECIQKNMAAIAAGRPQDCVLFSALDVPVTYPIGAGQGKYLLKDRSGGGHDQIQVTAAARGEFSRRYNQLLATDTLATQSITAIATQYRLYFTGAGTVTLSGAATGNYSAGSHTITCTAGSLTLTVAGSVLTADLRFEADATIGLPEYQRVTTASDYDEVGYPTYWRAQTDDWAKSHMDPNGATKAYVFWAGQKLSIDDAIFVETSVSSSSVSNNGVLMLSQSTGGGDTFLLRSKGTAAANASQPAGGIARRVEISGTCDITNDVCYLTVNGTTTPNTADQGTGTYTEQDVFFAYRAGTSLFANIREYAPPTILFLQPTDSLSASHLAKLQRGYAKSVGVTL